MSHSLEKLIKPMPARLATEDHRAATPLELLFDLVSVIAIAAAATGLHHAIVENHTTVGLMSFAMAFFSIWWAWMNFTWFASAYDNDDAIYRIAVLVMMAGSLCLAAGITDMFATRDFTLGIIGYIIMRIAHVGLLIRASLHNPQLRFSSLTFAAGIILCQIGWVLGTTLTPPEHIATVFFGLVALEFMVPAAVSAFGTLPWHTGHIAERYGLLTIIVLGESLLSLTPAIQKVSHLPPNTMALGVHIVSGLLCMFAAWWLYFNEKNFHALKQQGSTFLWGYGHVLIFASIAAFGAGLAVYLDFLEHHAKISALVANLSMTIPAAIYVFSIWLVHERYNSSGLSSLIYPCAGLVILGCGLLPMALPGIAFVLVAVVLIQSRPSHA